MCFGQVIVSQEADSRAPNSHIVRKQKRFLGDFRIPFTTVYFNERVQGHFEIKIPLIHLGYTRSAITQEPPLLWIFATLHPRLEINQFDAEDFPVNTRFLEYVLMVVLRDLFFVFRYCKKWIRSVKSLRYVPSYRQFQPIVHSSQDEPILVCRYLRPLEPPMQWSPDIFLRFVSRIPWVDDVHLVEVFFFTVVFVEHLSGSIFREVVIFGQILQNFLLLGLEIGRNMLFCWLAISCGTNLVSKILNGKHTLHWEQAHQQDLPVMLFDEKQLDDQTVCWLNQ